MKSIISDIKNSFHESKTTLYTADDKISEQEAILE